MTKRPRPGQGAPRTARCIKTTDENGAAIRGGGQGAPRTAIV